MKSQRKSNREKAGIIAGLERKIHNLEVECGSLAAENRKLKKELEKYKGKEYNPGVDSGPYEMNLLVGALTRFGAATTYSSELWRELTGEKKENEHTGDVQQQK